MSNRMKKKSGALKYLILIVLIAVLVIVFYVSKGNDNNGDNPSSSDQPSSSNQPSVLPSDPSSNPDITPVPPTPSDDDDNGGTIIGGGDNVNTNIYTLYDTYVLASEQTQYGESGYKYFIVRSYSDYEKYIEQNLKSPFDNSYTSSYSNLNTQTISNIKANIDKDFFKTNCLLFIVDYSNKEISGAITNVNVSENNVTLNIDRTITSNNKSKYNTYIVPIEASSIKSVSISYIR